MKAITLWQPWAQLSVTDDKHIETRCWATNYRGIMAIHASAKSPIYLTREPYNSLVLAPITEYCDINIADLPLGAIVGTVFIIDCLPIEQLYGTVYDTPKERACGDWTAGRYGWVLEYPVIFTPIPAKGHQGFWNWENNKK